MLSNKALSALYNIRHNILAARRFTAAVTFEQFKQSDLHFYAVGGFPPNSERADGAANPALLDAYLTATKREGR
jgi:hypothetical protein